MKRVCAWCSQQMGTVEGSKFPDSETSHGICRRCLDNFLFQQGVPLQQYLDSLPIPVVALDRHVVIKAVNAAACRVLGKEPREIVQHLGGNVFECANARLPEGCGGTVHCSGCAIRRAVTRTFETGESQMGVPAKLRHLGAAAETTVSLTITTVKAGNVVMLQVHGLEPPP